MIDSPDVISYRYRIWPAASRLALIAGALGLLGGCGTLASQSIVTARTPVNEAVATTARQQTLMNIVRVYHNDAPVILDVVEADEMVNVTGSATGGATNIGAIVGNQGGTLSGRTESAMGTVGAGDAVTNRYVPLQGQALISQLSTQITVETITALYDSDWPIQSLIDLSVTRLTPALNDFDLAEDILTELDHRRLISLATTKSRFSKSEDKFELKRDGEHSIVINNQPTQTGGGDTLNVYFNDLNSRFEMRDADQNRDVWRTFFNLYAHSQPTKDKGSIEANGLSSVVELRNSPITNLDKIPSFDFRQTYLGPILRTYTTTGILKYITTQPKISIIDENSYAAIRALPWNSREYFRRCPDADTYIVDPSDQNQTQIGDDHIFFTSPIKNDEVTHIVEFLKAVGSGALSTFDGKGACIFSYPFIGNKAPFSMQKTSYLLGKLKRFILVVTSNHKLENAFTSWQRNGTYYSIMSDDYISQRNLMLISQFLTIQATSTPTPSLTTISPSGR